MRLGDDAGLGEIEEHHGGYGHPKAARLGGDGDCLAEDDERSQEDGEQVLPQLDEVEDENGCSRPE